MDKLKEIVNLGIAYGNAKAAAEYSEGVLEAKPEEQDVKTAAAISVVANRRAMDKVASTFHDLCKE